TRTPRHLRRPTRLRRTHRGDRRRVRAGQPLLGETLDVSPIPQTHGKEFVRATPCCSRRQRSRMAMRLPGLSV
ncbi:hypothetical protein ACFQ07_28730, partial [Actinomadura adrarensis]